MTRMETSIFFRRYVEYFHLVKLNAGNKITLSNACRLREYIDRLEQQCVSYKSFYQAAVSNTNLIAFESSIAAVHVLSTSPFSTVTRSFQKNRFP